MELLLILSAILTALTGAISGARAPEMQIHQASGAVSGAPALISVRNTPVQGVRAYLLLAYGWAAPDRQAYSFARFAPAHISSIPRYLDKLRN